MAKKFKATEAQLANDRSLRWADYCWGELLWSDAHQDVLRFLRREPGGVRLATVNGISELPELFGEFSVRRPSVMDRPSEADWSPVKLRTDEGFIWIAHNRQTNERVRVADQSAAEIECQRRMSRMPQQQKET